ncbi:MAG: hypothetical protein R3279_05280 [Putridiphycobacter sp.]|nr:hypothetical protein [Putridiphycobacter sp.]
MKATKVHIAINILCFITIIISLYFGMSIFNANDNQHITHLNNFDNYTYYDIKDITVLTAQAVIISSVFLLTAFGLQIYSYFISKTKRKKHITLGLLTIYLILFFFSIFVMVEIETRDFYHYGMVWVLLSLTIIFANSVLIFLKRI